jgi:DNA-directed RNA polymerase subunit RPC12/RpoP
MATGIPYRCDHCDFGVMAWSDGNPYYFDEQGLKRYAYHPDHANLARCVGNDRDYLCLDCGAKFREDYEVAEPKCSQCMSRHVAAFGQLDGKSCPHCKSGTIREDEEGFAIS